MDAASGALRWFPSGDRHVASEDRGPCERIELWVGSNGIDIDRCLRVGESPFDVADAHSADVAYYYEHVLEVSGDFQPGVEEAFEWPPSRVLFLHDVNVDAEQRRQGFASLVAADAILTLATQGTAVFAHPGPTDLGSTDEDDLTRFRSETENTRFLASLGFEPFRDRMWLLDLATEAATETLAAIRGGVRHA